MNAPAPAPADPLAEAAVAPIVPGMVVGLGTGRAASRAVRALIRRAAAERLDLRAVPTSRETEALARAGGLTILPLPSAPRIDYLFDGADEVDGKLRMLKGGHGAVVAERLAASLAARRVYLVQESKLIRDLGSRMPLPIVILPLAESAARAGVRALGLEAGLRRTPGGEPFRTDEGLFILDARLAGRDATELARELDALPGVVDHGLFNTECDELLVEAEDGRVRRMERPDQTAR